MVKIVPAGGPDLTLFIPPQNRVTQVLSVEDLRYRKGQAGGPGLIPSSRL